MTKTFEKEFRRLTAWVWVEATVKRNILKTFEKWHSDEEFQELKEKLEDTRDSLDIARNRSDEFERGYHIIKSQIQDIPEIPDFVAKLVDYTRDVQHTIPSDIIEYFHFGNENFPTENMNLPSDILDLDKLSKYFTLGVHRYEFEKACILGFTVKKTCRFYLKNKITGNVLVYDDSPELSEVSELFATSGEFELENYTFTQPEIDSMETGNYEQIAVDG